MMMMLLSSYIVTVQDCFRLYRRSLIIQLLVFIAYAVSIPRIKPSAGAIAQRVLDMGLHAAPVGVPVIMIFCSITAAAWLKPKTIEELRRGSLKIVGETEVVAFDKTGTLTGSLVSMHARPDMRAVNAVFWAARYTTGLLIKLTPKGIVFSFVFFFLNAVFIANLISSFVVHPHLRYQRPHRIAGKLLHVIACLVRYGQLLLWCVLIQSFSPAKPEDFLRLTNNVIPPFQVEACLFLFSFCALPSFSLACFPRSRCTVTLCF